MKTYEVPTLEEVETLCANLDRHAQPAHLVLQPKDFGRLLATFHSGQTDVTLLSLPATAGEGVKRLRLASFRDAARPDAAGAGLTTRLAADTSEDWVVGYRHRGDEAAEATVNLKDLRVAASFCEAVDSDCALHFSAPGAPLICCPDSRRRITSYFGGAERALDYDAEVVLATMSDANGAALDPTEAVAAAAAAAGRGRAASAAPPLHDTPHAGSAPPAAWPGRDAAARMGGGAESQRPAPHTDGQLRWASAEDRSLARGEPQQQPEPDEDDGDAADGWARVRAPPKRPRGASDVDEDGEADVAFY